MSDCRFGISPVNYPDPDPGFKGWGVGSFQEPFQEPIYFMMNRQIEVD